MRVYQSSDGRWIFFNGITKIYYDTQAEAMQTMSKAKLVTAIVQAVKKLVEPMEECPDVWQAYFDIIGSDSLTDADVAHTGLSTATIIDLVTTMEQFNNFCNNRAVIQAAHRININKAKHSEV